MSHPGSQGHTWAGEETGELTSWPSAFSPPSLLCFHLSPFICFTSSLSPSFPFLPVPSPTPLPSLPLPQGALTGRSLAPEIGSGRCLRWHRVLGNSRTATLEMETRMRWEQVALRSTFPPGTPRRDLPAAAPHRCSEPHHCLDTLVPNPHVVLTPQTPDPRPLSY